jgi:hypothetical protein
MMKFYEKTLLWNGPTRNYLMLAITFTHNKNLQVIYDLKVFEEIIQPFVFFTFIIFLFEK